MIRRAARIARKTPPQTYRLNASEQAQFDRAFALSAPSQQQEALAIYQALGEKGHATSQYNTGIIYRDMGNTGAAIPWFERAIKSGDPEAHCPLGNIQLNIGNDQAAARHYEQAAAYGYACGQARLANLYAEGRGVKRDFRKSFAFAEKAARQNSADGHCLLALHYLNSWSVPYNPELARSWLEKAAAQGHQDAIAALKGE